MKTAEGIFLGRFRRSYSWKSDGTGRFAKDRFPCPLVFPSDFPPRKTDRPAARSPCRSRRFAPGSVPSGLHRERGQGEAVGSRSTAVRFPSDSPRQMRRRFGLPFPNPAAVVCDRGPCMSACFLCPSRGHKMPSGKRDDTASRYFGICIRAPVVRFSRLGEPKARKRFRPADDCPRKSRVRIVGRPKRFPGRKLPAGETGGTFSGPESPDYFFRFINSAIFLGRSVLSITPLIPSAPVPYR